MRQLITFLFPAIMLISCKGQHKNEQNMMSSKDTGSHDSISHSQPVVAPNKLDKADLNIANKAKEWLIYNVEHDLNGANGNAENSNEEAEQDKKSIYTKQYDEYKNDAMNVDLDEGLSQEQFYDKWKDKYNPKFAGIGTGLLIAGQDDGNYGLIKVTHCDLKNKLAEGFVFNVVIEDLDAKKKYNRDIKVIPSADTFLIDDVMEY